MAKEADRPFRNRRAANGRVFRRHLQSPRRHSFAEQARDGAVFRRIRRNAIGDSLAIRNSHQSGLGTRAAQTLLPFFQLRVAGSSVGRWDCDIAWDYSFFPARASLSLSELQNGPRSIGASIVGCPNVWNSLALECDARAGSPPAAWWTQNSCPAATHGIGKPPLRRLSRPIGMPREY